jgi:Nif-specific regulatory protein
MSSASEKIESLYKITLAIHSSLDLDKSLYNVLDIMSKNLGMNRGSITIIDPETQHIYLKVAHGMSDTEKSKGRYKLGEGITGKVAETGRPMAIPKLDEEPLFLDRTGARKKIDKSKISFICVPIKDGRRVIGTLSVDRVFDKNVSLDEDVRLLTIISGLIAQKVSMLEEINREKELLQKENLRLRKQLHEKYSFSNIIGKSRKMQEVFYLITQVAKSDATVLLLGESGTGKELVANAIHYNSLRADKPFIKVNCAALPADLVEAELFGYEKGAFTGAIRAKEGKFELAHEGTIFLDEIGSLALDAQAKLLRVLQEKEVERLGSKRPKKVDVRLIAATNKDLAKAVEKGEFREDLYYRLNVYPIYLPPLRERGADILLLAEHFLEKYSRQYGKDIKRISTPAIDALMQYHWPGNVRELENCIERAVLLCEDQVIRTYHLPPSLQTAKDTSTYNTLSLKETVENLEIEMITDALKETKGNIRKAARLLQTTERILGYKIKKYQIDPKRFR